MVHYFSTVNTRYRAVIIPTAMSHIVYMTDLIALLVSLCDADFRLYRITFVFRFWLLFLVVVFPFFVFFVFFLSV